MAKPAIRGFGPASGWNRVQVTGFTNGEEDEMRLSHVVPFLVEDELLRLGTIFEKKADWQTFRITDGRLITQRHPRALASFSRRR
jgi:putative intracellular protease/amidase